jgi:hypothetical protein
MQARAVVQGKLAPVEDDNGRTALQNGEMLRQDCNEISVASKGRGLYEITA